MQFDSLEYLIALPLAVAVFYLIPHRGRWLWLLLVSYGFYAVWNPWCLTLILGSTLVDFAVGIWLGKTERPLYRNLLLLLSLGTNLGLLFTFKYLSPAFHVGNGLFEALHLSYIPQIDTYLMPVGISFYTFQTLSYTIDVYRKRVEPTRHLGRFALFVSFFPQLVAGPIERYSHLYGQLERPVKFKDSNLVAGMQLMVWGLFKKIVISDRLAMVVDAVYADPESYQGFGIWMGMLMFGFQVFCDFSAYTDMAIGSARMIGVELSPNFENRIYFAPSKNRFWSGWHMTLIAWWRDYVFFPIAGRGKSRIRWYGGLFVIYLLTGIWHGAGWNFMIWGVANGIYVLIEYFIMRRMAPWRNQLEGKARMWFNVGGTAITMFISQFTGMAFRVPNLDTMWTMLDRMWMFAGSVPAWDDIGKHIALGGFLLLVMDQLHIRMKNRMFDQWLSTLKPWQSWGLVTILIYVTLAMADQAEVPFQYFQF
ncbi:MBOAT family O-acyltransferase [Pontibacter sp. G13]|uniref:MBOAT family O-acyltransferase n=1 Tax=Pontibacter sp. G13 TaxID=3074898 RepID=UPI002889545E|nr:MBOAT family O-acyltransferase [Pontibacter sp. G13]WNJ19781.1 MBOAT family O-acyltransferase [Pontibacter sp. G13]